MNNSAPGGLHWSRLLGLCPLAVIGLTFSEALLFSVALLLTLVLSTGGMALLQRWIATAQRPIANALLAAICVAAVDLLLQATCYQYAQNLTTFLPLLIIVAVLLEENTADKAIHFDKTLGYTVSNAMRVGGFFSLTLVIFATLRIFVPAEASIALSLIGSGLMLALAARLYPDRPTGNSQSNNTTRIRARVTGPVR